MRNRSVLGSYEESRHVISVGLDGRSNKPIGTWKRGAPPPGHQARRGQEPGETNVGGDVTNGGWGCQAECKRNSNGIS
jgi:hypothetical protein